MNLPNSKTSTRGRKPRPGFTKRNTFSHPTSSTLSPFNPTERVKRSRGGLASANGFSYSSAEQCGKRPLTTLTQHGWPVPGFLRRRAGKAFTKPAPRAGVPTRKNTQINRGAEVLFLEPRPTAARMVMRDNDFVRSPASGNTTHRPMVANKRGTRRSKPRPSPQLPVRKDVALGPPLRCVVTNSIGGGRS